MNGGLWTWLLDLSAHGWNGNDMHSNNNNNNKTNL